MHLGLHFGLHLNLVHQRQESPGQDLTISGDDARLASNHARLFNLTASFGLDKIVDFELQCNAKNVKFMNLHK
jgi:hypothetical protein